MKFTKYFMPFAALALLASCSDDNLVDNPKSPSEDQKGDLYFSMTFSQASVGTRTATDNGEEEDPEWFPGKENGTSDESNITSALVIFAEKTTTSYDVIASVYCGGTSETKITKSNDTYTANFAMTRDKLLDQISSYGKDVETDGVEDDKEFDFYLFVIANAPADYMTKYSAGTDVQKVFDLDSDNDIYWRANQFLMANNAEVKKTIKASEIALGTHVTADKAYELGEVEVIRSMSRFDIASSDQNTIFNTSSKNSDIKDLTITFDAVAMINMANKANLFKSVSENNATVDPDMTINFGKENSFNWVVTPDISRSNYLEYLYEEDEDLGWIQKDLSEFFTTESVYAGYTKMSSIVTPDDNNYTQPSDLPGGTQLPNYFVWRYAMENTNPYEVDEQKNGNSTGVIFRAKITGTINVVKDEIGDDGVAYEKKDIAELTDGTYGQIYAYNNVIFGNFAALQKYLKNRPPFDQNAEDLGEYNLWEVVNEKYNKAVAAYEAQVLEDDTEGKYSGDTAEAIPAPTEDQLKPYLVKKQGFTVYSPDDKGNYYCYYLYWNRHNDNNLPTIMGIMEFATVRNNVYKLAVTKVMNLGHPADPDDDPDPTTPNTPNESDKFYCTIDCKVLPWDVRVNNIEF
ncbi:MAG: Mfa1 fimbrilin C-terminal domain-containing protein [Muribaculaceae bacterium]|nr:Mfa1 fimbrilin C-terminal domain-containing protein [Muribaculaceae bacterium]